MKKGLISILGTILLTFIFSFTNITKLNAASGTISVRSSKSTVVIGGTFNVNIVVSSNEVLGSWGFTVQYDTSKLKLMSDITELSVADTGDGKQTSSKTYTYTFKAIAKGTSTINLAAISGYAWDESVMTFNAGSVRVTNITQADLEASYSKNNNLSSLGVTGYNLSIPFNKDTTEYTVTVPSDIEKITLTAEVEDKKASVSGIGEFEVSEGENNFEIIVTAENGSQKTYKVKVKVEDENPIEVQLDGLKYNVVKRASTLKAPATFEPTTTLINGIEVPAFKSNITNFILVGLKSQDGKQDLYIYNNEKNTFTLYVELKTKSILLFPKKSSTAPDYYKITKIDINGTTVEAYQYDGVKDYYLVYGVNIETGDEGFYQYDMLNNTITRYNDKIINELTKKNENFLMIIIILGVETIVVLLILIITLTKKNKTKKVSFKEFERELESKPDDKKELNNNKEDKNDDKKNNKNKKENK